MNVILIQTCLIYAILAVLSVAGIMSIINVLRKPRKELSIFSLFVVSLFVFEAIGMAINLMGIHTDTLVALFNINSCLFLSWFYFESFVRYSDKIRRRAFGILSFLLLLMCIIFWKEEVLIFPPKFIVQVFYLITSIGFIFHIYSRDREEYVLRALNFFNSGILLLSSAGILIVLFKSKIASFSIPTQQLIYVNVTATNLIAYLVILIGTILIFRNKT